MSLPAYHRDPWLRTLTTEVVRVGATGAGQPLVVLADTILYPEGGGQPADQGTIGPVRVVDVQRIGPEVLHLLDGPLAVDTTAQVRVELDWTRRLDHMQQHTAQHLLTAIADTRHGWATTAFHLGPELSDIELDTPSLTTAQLERLEDEVATEIAAARPVRTRLVEPDQLASLEVRTRGLPEDIEGPVRLVEIEGLDLNTCGGTHLSTTAQLTGLCLVGTEPLRGGTRVFFVAGDRLRRRMAAHETRNARLRTLLGAPDSELVDLVSLRLERAREQTRTIKRLAQDLARAQAELLAASGEPVVSGAWPYLDMPFLQALARSLLELAPDTLALLVAGPESDGCFLLAAGPDSGIDLAELGPRVCDLLSGRGGGRAPIFQGKASRLDRREQAVELIRATRAG
jgi:Ser-tRNA(Ala) deacylase AlaX